MAITTSTNDVISRLNAALPGAPGEQLYQIFADIIADLTTVEAVTAPLSTPVTLAAASTLTAAQSGTTFFLNAETEFATTLPAPAAGLRYTFIVGAAPSGASYTIVTNASAQIIVGRAVNSAGVAGDTEDTAGATTCTFVDGQAVLGDRLDLVSDGTLWYGTAVCAVAAGFTFTG